MFLKNSKTRVKVDFADGSNMITSIQEMKIDCFGGVLQTGIPLYFYCFKPETKKEVRVHLVSVPDEKRKYYVYSEIKGAVL